MTDPFSVETVPWTIRGPSPPPFNTHSGSIRAITFCVNSYSRSGNSSAQHQSVAVHVIIYWTRSGYPVKTVRFTPWLIEIELHRDRKSVRVGKESRKRREPYHVEDNTD